MHQATLGRGLSSEASGQCVGEKSCLYCFDEPGFAGGVQSWAQTCGSTKEQLQESSPAAVSPDHRTFALAFPAARQRAATQVRPEDHRQRQCTSAVQGRCRWAG